jgi:hypothetical protein
MKKSPPDSSVVRGLRTGRIHATQASASEIRRLLGVRPSEVKVAEKALRLVMKPSEIVTVKVLESKPARTSPGSRTSRHVVKHR